MGLGTRDPAENARRVVADWFALSPGGARFLTGDGRVLPLGMQEALTIRDEAEAKAIALYKAMDVRVWMAIGALVVVFMTMQSLASRLSSPWDEIGKAIAFTLYAAHGLWVFWEVYRTSREMKDLRADIALSLASRVPIDQARAGALAKINPIPAVLIGIVALLLAGNWLAEFLGHVGIDVLALVPMWLYLPLTVFLLIVIFGNHWIDRRRGVGMLPTENRTNGAGLGIDR